VVWVFNIVTFSAILQLGLLLQMVETFHRVTFAGVGLNALAIPVMTVLLALALPVNLLSVVSPAAAVWPAKLLSGVMALLFDMTHVPELAPWLSYRMPAPPMWVACGFCGAFVLAALTLRFAPRRAGIALGACAVFVALITVQPFAPRLPHGTLELTALDCGPGEAVFIVLPSGTTMLIDAGDSRVRAAREGTFQGRRWDVGEDIVSPYLWSRGIKKIDVVALTRALAGSAGGLDAIFANFHVSEFWHPPERETSEYEHLLEEVAQHNVPTRTLIPGDVLSLGATSICVAGPDPGPPSSAASRDAIPLAMRISTGGMHTLLAGDTVEEANHGISACGEAPRSQVLILPNYNSQSAASVNFVARVAPWVAVVSSAGRNDDERGAGIGKPTGRLQTGTRIFRTDTDGATTVEWSGATFAVRSYSGRGWATKAGLQTP
jgi:competence protein ComEC